MAKQQVPEGEYPLFRLAVLIMAIVSCYTTAKGLEPMWDNWILSIGVAIALSIFMVAIAWQFPSSYQTGNHRQLIWGYSAVAFFSVLLNFNAIYGSFMEQNLYQNELKSNKAQIIDIQSKGTKLLKAHFGVDTYKKRVDSLLNEYKAETNNPSRYGHGKIAQDIYARIPGAEAELKSAEGKFNPDMEQINRIASNALVEIDTALRTESVPMYKQAIDLSIDAYNKLNALVVSRVGKENFQGSTLKFENEDVGKLNHSLWTITQIFKMDGAQAFSVIVSIILAILIDFIVLFVLIILNRPDERSRSQMRRRRNSRSRRRVSFNHPGSRPEAPLIEERES